MIVVTLNSAPVARFTNRARMQTWLLASGRVTTRGGFKTHTFASESDAPWRHLNRVPLDPTGAPTRRTYGRNVLAHTSEANKRARTSEHPVARRAKGRLWE